MQLRADALDQHVARTLAPLYVITSDEHLLALEAADKIRRAARAQGYSERDVLTVERNFKWGELLAANQAMSLFGDKKLIELRIPSGKPGKDGGAALQAYAKDLSPDNLTLITLPKLDWQTQKAAWVAALQQAAVYIDIPNIERNALPGWIANRLAAQGQARSAPAWTSSPTALKATCWRHTRKSRNSACCTSRASWPTSRCRTPCSMWRATTCSSCPKPCFPATPHA